MSDQEPDPGETPTAATPEPESEPGAEATEAFADTASGAAPAQSAEQPPEQPELPTNVGKSPEGTALEGQWGQQSEPPTSVGESTEPTGRAGRAGRSTGGRGRAVWAIGLGVGYVILAAGTAFGVIIDKTPAAVDVTAANASAYAAPVGAGSQAVGTSGAGGKTGAAATGSAKAKSSPSPTTAPTTASPTPTPTPSSTVTGSVSDGIHSGDLRYFLVTPPQGPSSVQGDPDGTTETLDEAVVAYGGDSSQASILQDAGFKAACERTYQDSTLGANVDVQLIQFKSSDEAEAWTESFGLSGAGFASISVPGVSGAKGWSYAKDGGYNLVGIYREGDTFFQVEIYGTQALPAADLGQVVSAEHSRLANG